MLGDPRLELRMPRGARISLLDPRGHADHLAEQAPRRAPSQRIGPADPHIHGGIDRALRAVTVKPVSKEPDVKAAVAKNISLQKP